MIETFFLDRPHESLGECVEIRTSSWDSNQLDVRRFDYRAKRRRVFTVAIKDQVLHSVQESSARHCHVSGDLLHPLLMRIPREPRDMDLAGSDLHEKQD